MFPQWTEHQTDDIEAIQHLRLNELRDHINEALFPYVTLITPYLRLVSWLVWIYSRMEYEREKAREKMRIGEYAERASRYYGIFATADTLHSIAVGFEHRGPVGVDIIRVALNRSEGNSVDFRQPSFGASVNPTSAYANVMFRMRLLNRMAQPVTSRSEVFFYVTSETGKQLANTFESNWRDVVDPEVLSERLVWSKKDLLKLGEAICSQGLSINNGESKLLLDAIRSSFDKLGFYDSFIELVLAVARKAEESEASFRSEDLGRAALYQAVKIGGYKKLKIEESLAAALLAYHELHTHASYGADAILAGITKLAEAHPTGIPLSTVVDEANKALLNDSAWQSDKLIEKVVDDLKSIYPTGSWNVLRRIPTPSGSHGFETVQEKINSSSEDAPALIAWGAIALLQASYIVDAFDKNWLQETLPFYNKVFSAYTFLEEFQALHPHATIKSWLERVIERVIEQHEDVAASKGEYARRFERVRESIYYRADALYSLNRGRQGNALAWLSDVGLLKRTEADYSLSPEGKKNGNSP